MQQNNPFVTNWRSPSGPQVFSSRPTMPMPSSLPPSPMLTGRIVSNEDEINAREVPMDGIGLFPKNDGACIYVKTWNNQGSITTDRYILEQAQPVQTGPSEFDQVMYRLSKLEEMLVMINPDLKALVDQAKIVEEVQQ